MTSTIDDADVYKISSGLINAVNDFDTYYNENQEILEQYIEYKKIKEYRGSDAVCFRELFRKFGETSGYYDENLLVLWILERVI
ncbi:hypothetical protein CULT_1450008 [[Clostridium] ultunense Esp]|uniref:Uncharacterized protein n=1 Tax=[Clostridium] ultunense Esp TaxID=1288971 RepID=M1Z7E8_9FIRM|nr:hypothetical protein [Schnuerera ultunensis]CCQ93654.1 hypothetical protein CULT_1450008 [[Clostridium] ultunense Esp]SHD78108.1 conserved protein of unknown function [[Clostridium] ultunense Esp]